MSLTYDVLKDDVRAGRPIDFGFVVYVPERTCRMEYNERWSHDEYYPTECYNCSECGHMTFDGVPTFCPNCGARVTKEASDDADR